MNCECRFNFSTASFSFSHTMWCDGERHTKRRQRNCVWWSHLSVSLSLSENWLFLRIFRCISFKCICVWHEYIHSNYRSHCHPLSCKGRSMAKRDLSAYFTFLVWVLSFLRNLSHSFLCPLKTHKYRAYLSQLSFNSCMSLFFPSFLWFSSDKTRKTSFSSLTLLSIISFPTDTGSVCRLIGCSEEHSFVNSVIESTETTTMGLTSLSKTPVKRPRLIDLNEWITCYLCGGYLIDATTLVDCTSLHSFCRSCIVKYVKEFESIAGTRPFCPVCETPLHESKPTSSLRSDRRLQDIVYKLVPGLYKSE